MSSSADSARRLATGGSLGARVSGASTSMSQESVETRFLVRVGSAGEL